MNYMVNDEILPNNTIVSVNVELDIFKKKLPFF